MTCGRRRVVARVLWHACCDARGRAADKRASCGYTCRGRGGGVFCSSGVTTAAGCGIAPLRSPNAEPVSEILFSVSAVVARQQLSRQRGGSDGRTSATAQKAKTLHACLDATRLYRAASAMCARATLRESLDFVQLGVRKPLHTPRGAVALLPRRGLLPGCNVHPHRSGWRPEGSVGATRARTGPRRDARSTLRGMGGPTSGSRVSARHVHGVSILTSLTPVRRLTSRDRRTGRRATEPWRRLRAAAAAAAPSHRSPTWSSSCVAAGPAGKFYNWAGTRRRRCGGGSCRSW